MSESFRHGKGALVVLVAILMLLAVGCGSDSNDNDDNDADNDGTSQTPSADEVPDPCDLVDSDDLADILGSSPGASDSMAVVPEERKVCTYETGILLAVEVASHWESSIKIIREHFGEDALVEESGLGEEAYWQEVGSQVLALEDDYFVGVTGVADRKQARAIAEEMLDELD